MGLFIWGETPQVGPLTWVGTLLYELGLLTEVYCLFVMRYFNWGGTPYWNCISLSEVDSLCVLGSLPEVGLITWCGTLHLIWNSLLQVRHLNLSWNPLSNMGHYNSSGTSYISWDSTWGGTTYLRWATLTCHEALLVSWNLLSEVELITWARTLYLMWEHLSRMGLSIWGGTTYLSWDPSVGLLPNVRHLI